MTGTLPSAVVTIGGTRVLDWQMAAFHGHGDPEFLFVGGYRAEEVETRYPEIRYFFNPRWSETGPAASLSLVPLDPSIPLYVSYADIVFRPQLIDRFQEEDADLVIAVDSQWQVRYENRSRADMDAAEKVLLRDGRLTAFGSHVPTEQAGAEFVGVMRLMGPVIEVVRDILGRGHLQPKSGVPELVELLLEHGIRPHLVDVEGEWAELNAPQDLARFVLGTKAESLERLRGLVRKGHIGPLVAFSHARWRREGPGVVEEIRRELGDTELMVRSSALSEDNWLESAAGAYASVPDVPAGDHRRLQRAIEEVFASYGEPRPEDQVLVQEMLSDVSLSGVVMTRVPSSGAPYYVFNFDDTSRRTDTVTAGTSGAIRTVYLHRGAVAPQRFPTTLPQVLEAVREVEELVGHDSLDIEFAVTGDELCHVLQVRPIAISRAQPVVDDNIADRLGDARAYLEHLFRPDPFVLGATTQLSVMTDWNPAEMIGTKPGRLALSLYRRLITDEVWASQRAEYGYRDVRPRNLIVDVLGHPYVDIRADFNSFVPAELDDELAAKLVTYYLDTLERSPALHDKVEFDILFTCLTFDFDRRSRRLLDAGFEAREVAALRTALRRVTRAGIRRCDRDLAALEELSERFSRILGAQLEPLERSFLLLEDARRIGVPLFAHLARAGFVAVSLLRSLESEGVIDERQKEEFLATLRTIPTIMREDAARVREGDLSWDELVRKYGHLRPGSYDITSPSYRSAPDDFLGPLLETEEGASIGGDQGTEDCWDASARRRIEELLLEEDLCDFDQLDQFLRAAITGRELGKFVFMRNVDAALEALAEFGAEHGASRDDLAHLTIDELWSLRGASTEGPADALRRMSQAGRESFYVTQAVCLPGQIFAPDDIDCFEQLRAEPNFVTSLRVHADVVVLGRSLSPASTDIQGKLVLIPNADPGFDWLFSREIAGLITTYGGVNSHMAIRAAELRLPAAIGIGEMLFETLSAARRLELDCAARRIIVVA